MKTTSRRVFALMLALILLLSLCACGQKEQTVPDEPKMSTDTVSYTHLEYSYDFYITIFVNNPYFDEMRFQLNSSSVDITPPPAMRPGMTTRFNPETNVEYRNYKKLGEEIRQVLTQVRKDVREKIEPVSYTHLSRKKISIF